MLHLDEAKKILSEAQEDYLKQIYMLLGDSCKSLGTQVLADRLNVAPASATVMLQKLRGLGLVNYTEYKGVVLTDLGLRAALEIVRHHRLLESFLHKALGYGWEEVHEEAEKLEHYISETFEARMAAWLGNPEFDPHGDPIPNEELIFPIETSRLSLTQVPEDFSGCIVRVATQDRDELNLLAHLHLTPGQQVRVIANEVDGVRLGLLKLGLSSEDHRFLLPLSLASKIFIQGKGE